MNMRHLWLIWVVMATIILLGDVPKWITDPNWVKYATLGGGLLLFIYTLMQGARQRRRRRNLIRFPDNWRMERNLDQKKFKFQLRAFGFASHTSIQCGGAIRIRKRPVAITDSNLEQSHGSNPFWMLNLTASLDSIPEGVHEVEAKLTVTLDDGTKRDSGWRTSPIIIWPPPSPPNPGTEALQPSGDG
jgi:hypothetical protein